MTYPVDLNRYTLTSVYGNRPQYNDFHSGVDFAPKSRQPDQILSCEDGVVTFVGLTNKFFWNGKYYQNPVIIIDHGNNISSLYMHNERADVSSGQNVKQGQVIGLCGNRGASDGTHLHFEIRVNGKAVDPMPYLNKTQTQTIMENDKETTIRPGEGLSQIALRMGFSDYSQDSRWQAIAELNGYTSWRDFRSFAGNSIRVRQESVKVTVAPTPISPPSITPPHSHNDEEKKALQEQLIESQKLIDELNIILDKKAATEKENVGRLESDKMSLNNQLFVIKKQLSDANLEILKAKQSQVINLEAWKLEGWQAEAGKKIIAPYYVNFMLKWNSLPQVVRYGLPLVFSVSCGSIVGYISTIYVPDLTIYNSTVSGSGILSYIIKTLQHLNKLTDQYIQDSDFN